MLLEPLPPWVPRLIREVQNALAGCEDGAFCELRLPGRPEPFQDPLYYYTLFTKGPLRPEDPRKLVRFLAQHALHPRKGRILSGGFLRRTGRMRHHYGVMERATLGYQGFTHQARRQAARLDPPLTAENSLGGYALTREYDLDPAMLFKLWWSHPAGILRLGPGTRAIRLDGLELAVRLPDRIEYLVNANIPHFMSLFEQPGFRTLILEVQTVVEPAEFRERVLGEQEPPGSLRAELPHLNCHGSAGVVEAIVEDANLGLRSDPLGHPYVPALESRGLARSRLASFLENPDVRIPSLGSSAGGREQGEQEEIVSVYDATERLDLDAVAATLTDARLT